MNRLYDGKWFTIFFGDFSTSLVPDMVCGKSFNEVFSLQPWAEIQKKMGIEKGFFCHQVHGTSGIIIDKNFKVADQPLFVNDGDYLITALSKIGIGVVTADCLPLALIDQKKRIISVIHAGWKGLLAGIVEQVIDQFKIIYSSQVKDLRFFVGPAAGACCYEVGFQFSENIVDKNLLRQAFYEKSGTLFFDMKELLRILCLRKNISVDQIEMKFSDCTICKMDYCSFRRNNKAPDRQLTIIALK